MHFLKLQKEKENNPLNIGTYNLGHLFYEFDPLNHSNNVAKNTRQFDKIKLAFSLGALAAREQCECGCHFEKEGYSDYMKTEHCLLKRIFNSVKRTIDDSY